MPVCESCGSDIKPGKKFCTECGAPVVKPGVSSPSPPVPPPPQQIIPPLPPLPSPLPAPSSPVSSPKPQLPLDKIIIAAVLVVAIAGIILFIGLPLLQAPGTNNKPLTDSVQVTPTPPRPVPAVTTPPASTPLPTGTVQNPSGTIVYRSGVPYIQVYSKQYELGMARSVFSYTLKEPPLLIECDLNPETVTREKLVDIGTSNERYITATYPDPSAWLDLKVINADTDSVIETIRFSKNYVGMLNQEYTIRAPGNYRFEIAGSLVSPTVRLLVKQ